MKYFFTTVISCFVLLLPAVSVAASFQFPAYRDYEDMVQVTAPFSDQIFYGRLDDFPHTYILQVPEKSDFYLEVQAFTPDNSQPDKNLLVVKKNRDGSVTELFRINARDEEWQLKVDPSTRDEYWRGGSYRGELEAGEYLVEVNSAENRGVYALRLSDSDEPVPRSWFKEYQRVYELKQFLGQSLVSVFSSPLYYIPLIILLVCGAGWYGRRYLVVKE